MRVGTAQSFFLAAVALASSGICSTARAQEDIGMFAVAEELTFKFDEQVKGEGVFVDQRVFDPAVGYGYEPQALPAAGKPTLFSVRVPEGNYSVTFWLGSAASESNTTIKAESRQLIIHNFSTKAGEVVEVSALVNVRTPRIDENTRVGIKEREVGLFRWDDKLTLELNGANPRVAAIRITPVADARVIYLVGDSTVADQGVEPWNSWGQMLPAMLDLTRVAVSNHAESGESYASFIGARRWDKILTTLRAGDVVLMQMGHNDMKQKGDGVGAYGNYTAAMEKLIAETRARGATPIVMTSMHRRAFNDDGTVKQTLGDYPAAVRAVATKLQVDLIDLNGMSETLYSSFGKDGSAALFVDMTHHNNYGSYLLARCVAERLKQISPELSALVRTDQPAFDPAHPPTESELAIPASPMRDPTRPEGN